MRGFLQVSALTRALTPTLSRKRERGRLQFFFMKSAMLAGVTNWNGM
jgi:hypothetical protein